MKKAPTEIFHWTRPMGGYVWENAIPFPKGGEASKPSRPPESLFLVEQPMKDPLYERYAVLKIYPTLYETFANLEPTQEAFLEFANKHGKLGSGVPLFKNGPLRFGEPLQDWTHAHWKLRRVIEEVVAIRDRDVATLREWFDVTPESVSYSRRFSDGTFSANHLAIRQHEHRAWLLDWVLAAESEEDRILRAAKGWAQEEVNKIMGSGDQHGPQATVHARALLDTDAKQMSLHIVPTTLYAAMWLQCAKVLTEDATLQVCEQCGKQFAVAPGKRRRDSLYCSHACKIAAYRWRQVAIPKDCPHCGKKMLVECEATTGFGYMNVEPVTCPWCNVPSEDLRPGKVIAVRKAPKARAART